jgi:hypothetical protein
MAGKLLASYHRPRGWEVLFLSIFQPSQSTQRRQEAKAQKPVKKIVFLRSLCAFAPLR